MKKQFWILFSIFCISSFVFTSCESDAERSEREQSFAENADMRLSTIKGLCAAATAGLQQAVLIDAADSMLVLPIRSPLSGGVWKATLPYEGNMYEFTLHLADTLTAYPADTLTLKIDGVVATDYVMTTRGPLIVRVGDGTVFRFYSYGVEGNEEQDAQMRKLCSLLVSVAEPDMSFNEWAEHTKRFERFLGAMVFGNGVYGDEADLPQEGHVSAPSGFHLYSMTGRVIGEDGFAFQGTQMGTLYDVHFSAKWDTSIVSEKYNSITGSLTAEGLPQSCEFEIQLRKKLFSLQVPEGADLSEYAKIFGIPLTDSGGAVWKVRYDVEEVPTRSIESELFEALQNL